MKAIFLVNGTGMGHITQTFALQELLEHQGIPLEPVAVVATNVAPAKLALLREHYSCPVVPLPSLRFHTTATGEISPWRTAWGSLADLLPCRQSVAKLHDLIQSTQPEIVFNFYEALGGFYHLRHRSPVPWVAIGHQYMVHHPAYPRHARLHPQRAVLSGLTRLTGYGAALRVALSFYPAEMQGNLWVTAPLLRQHVLSARPVTGTHLLCYLNNGTHLPKLIRYCQRHPEQRVRCFCPDAPALPPANLEMFRPDWNRYVDELIQCRGLIATSGFESLAEAGVLGKPVVAIPLKNQLEQELNARDALDHGLIRRAVAPDAELPDVDWHSTRPGGEFRQFVLTENRRLGERLRQFLRPSASAAFAAPAPVPT